VAKKKKSGDPDGGALRARVARRSSAGARQTEVMRRQREEDARKEKPGSAARKKIAKGSRRVRVRQSKGSGGG
jgi:hypothetical protein